MLIILDPGFGNKVIFSLAAFPLIVVKDASIAIVVVAPL
jgi:hypothetical protein